MIYSAFFLPPFHKVWTVLKIMNLNGSDCIVPTWFENVPLCLQAWGQPNAQTAEFILTSRVLRDAQRKIFMSSSPFSNTSPQDFSIMTMALIVLFPLDLKTFLRVCKREASQTPKLPSSFSPHVSWEMLKGGFSCLHLHFPTLFLLQNRDDTLSRSRCAQKLRHSVPR